MDINTDDSPPIIGLKRIILNVGNTQVTSDWLEIALSLEYNSDSNNKFDKSPDPINPRAHLNDGEEDELLGEISYETQAQKAEEDDFDFMGYD